MTKIIESMLQLRIDTLQLEIGKVIRERDEARALNAQCAALIEKQREWQAYGKKLEADADAAMAAEMAEQRRKVAEARRERDEARAALLTVWNDAIEAASDRLSIAHNECCDPVRYDRGDCCGHFIPVQAAIRELKDRAP
jgi:hypothetical protein